MIVTVMPVLVMFAASASTDAQSVPGPAVVVGCIDGRQAEGRLSALDDTRLVLAPADGGPAIVLPRADVLTITVAGASPADLLAEPGRHLVFTDDGGRLAAADASIRQGELSAASPLIGRFTAPLERVVRLVRPRPTERPAEVLRRAAAAGPTADGDRIFLTGKSGQVAPLAGVIKTLDAGKAVIAYDGQETAIDAASLVAIEWARPPASGVGKTHGPVGRMTASSGETIPLTSVVLDGATLRLVSPSLGPVSVPASALARVWLPTDRVAYLSDVEPAAVRHTPYFDDSFPYVRDGAAGGGPISLGGAAYEKGLGLHARTELQYDLGGRYRQFAAVAGIDDSVPLGSAAITIVGDERTLVDRMLLERSGRPRPILLDITGVRRLVIVADFAGNTYGAGQRVDLAGARLIR